MSTAAKGNMEMLLEAGRLLSAKLDLPELLHAVMELAARVVNAETASLLLLDPKTNELYFDVAIGLDPNLTKTRIKLGQGIAGTVAAENKPVIINDVKKDARWSSNMDQASGFVTRSILATPITLKDRVIGVVEAINHIGGDFSFEDLRVFEAFASQAAIAIENARLFASLNEEKAKLNTIFNEMRDAAILIDEQGRFLLVNEAARKFITSSSHAVPQSIADALRGMALTPALEVILAPAQPLVSFEATREKPKKLVLAGTSSIVRASMKSGASGRVIVFRDVTEEKQEEGLKRTFLSLISHKLKTPLSSITGYSQLILDEMGNAGKAELLRKSAETIKLQGQKLNGLVDKLLNYTVLEELEGSEFRCEVVKVDDILTEAIEGMAEWLAENGGKALFEPAEGLTVYTDRALVRDVVKNLIENGIKFASKENRKVAIWAAAWGGYVEINVRDSGPGIPPEEQDKIFNKFYQVEAAFTGQVEGWGLGLSFVLRVVQKLGGSVRLQSRPNEGSTFTVILPAKAP